MRLAIVHKEKCKPAACGRECKKYCCKKPRFLTNFLLGKVYIFGKDVDLNM